jgi:hypothetical protein
MQPEKTICSVRLRRGGRVLGGRFPDQLQQLAAFSRESPFFGMACRMMPVTRQVLAEPDRRSTNAPKQRLPTARRRHRATTRQG